MPSKKVDIFMEGDVDIFLKGLVALVDSMRDLKEEERKKVADMFMGTFKPEAV
jgi:hypothetical protein